jgi:hypothetical protein
MRTDFPATVRVLVLAALAPLPAAACGGAQLTDGEADAGRDASAGFPGTTAGGAAISSTTTGGATSSGATSSGGGEPLPEAAAPFDATSCEPISSQNGTSLVVNYPCGLPVDSGSSCAAWCGTPDSGTIFSCGTVGLGYVVYCDLAPFDAAPPPDVYNFGGEGRRPTQLVGDDATVARSIGDTLARSAYLEAASVDAFRHLADEMEAHDAPASLVSRLRCAAEEEVEHARRMTALARARGVEPRAPIVMGPGARSVFAIAMENALEGCVRETWGAAIALARSMRAEDADVRDAMRTIASDELGHAALSWDLAAWLDTRLTHEQRAAVAEARAEAVAKLGAEVDRGVPAPWRKALGMPSPEEARAILAGMRTEVWGPDLAT